MVVTVVDSSVSNSSSCDGVVVCSQLAGRTWPSSSSTVILISVRFVLMMIIARH